MRDVKRRRFTQRMRWGLAISIFLGVNLTLRLALLPLNQAEYTDGVLQLIQFKEATGIYPPLYTAFAWILTNIMPALWAGRTVSALFSAAAVVPIYLLTLRSFGARAAIFAALVYTVAPESLRWAPRVMTEATFSFFFWFACERLVVAQGAKNLKDTNSALMGAGVFGALAALTRYQGLLFIPAILLMAGYKWRTKGFVPWKGCLAMLLYGLVFAWSTYAGSIHGEQFLERTQQLGPWMTFLTFGEPFFLSVPYFLTYPVFILAMVGMFVGHARRRFRLTPLTLYVFIVLLIAQSLFASFQERYLLPFYGLMYIWAGVGMAVVDDRCRRRRPRLRPYTPILVGIWSLTMATFVLLGSRGAFGDLAAASRAAAELVKTQGHGTIYANEIYRLGRGDQPPIAATKVSFFAGRKAQYLGPAIPGSDEVLEPGDVIVFSYRDDLTNEISRLQRFYVLDRVGTPFASVITPVFPDLMQDRTLEQSPMAWLFRYVNQDFRTDLLIVRSRKLPR